MIAAARVTLSPFLRALGAHVPVGAALVLWGLDPDEVQAPRRRLTIRTPHGWVTNDGRAMHRARCLVTCNPHSIEGRPEPLGYSTLVVDDDAQPETARALERLARVGVLPSIVVASGRPGHRHLYFLLDRLVPIEVGEPIARRLLDFCAADPNYSATHAAPPPAPGNLNTKTGQPVTLLELHEGRRYAPEAIDRALTRVGARPVGVFVAAAAADRARKRTPDNVSALSPVRVAPAQVVALVASLDPEARELVAAGAPRGQRSEAEASIVRKLLDRGACDDEIAAVFVRYPAGIGEKTAEEGLAHLERTINRIDSLRRQQHQGAESIEVHGAVGRAGVVRLDVELLTGPRAGARWWQPIHSGRIVEYVQRAFGLPPGTSLLRAAGEARVLLGEYAGRPNVTSWLPSEAAIS